MLTKLKSLKNHQGFMKYFKNTSWLFAEKVLRMIVGLFVGIWVARYLGPEQYGLFSYAQSFVGLFTAIATLGLDGIVIRELVKDKSKRDVLLGTAFILKGIGAFIALIFLFIAVNFTSNDHYTNILVFIIASATIFQSFNVIDMYFQSNVLSKYIVYANVITLLITSVIKVVLILIEAPLLAFVWVVLLNSFVLAIGYLYFYLHKQMSFKSWRFKKQTAKSLLKDSWPMIFSGLAISFYMKLDQTMVKELLNEESVGYYSAAVRLSEVWLFITVAITQSLYPAILNAKKVSEKLYYSRLQIMYQFLVLIAFVISVVVTLLSYQLIFYTFGEEYLVSVNILTIYVWSNIFVFLNNGSWSWYRTENLQHIAALRLILGAIANFFLNIVFIKKYGLEGAAYATILSYAIASYFGNLISKKTWINFAMQTKAIINIFNFRSYYK